MALDRCIGAGHETMLSDSLTLYEQARQAMERGALEEAVSLFERSISDSPHFKALELLGECLLKLGRAPEAIVPLAAATTLNKGVRAPALLAQVFLELAAYQDGLDMAKLALSRHPRNRMAQQVKEVAEAHLASV